MLDQLVFSYHIDFVRCSYHCFAITYFKFRKLTLWVLKPTFTSDSGRQFSLLYIVLNDQDQKSEKRKENCITVMTMRRRLVHNPSVWTHVRDTNLPSAMLCTIVQTLLIFQSHPQRLRMTIRLIILITFCRIVSSHRQTLLWCHPICTKILYSLSSWMCLLGVGNHSKHGSHKHSSVHRLVYRSILARGL